jgi:hypothetical protein
MSAAPAPRAGKDDAIEILHRLEPVLAGIQTDVSEIKARQAKHDETLTKVLVEVAELRGKVSLLPTAIQMLTAIVAILAAAFGMVKFGLR